MMRGHSGELGEDIPDIMGEERGEDSDDGNANGSEICSTSGLYEHFSCFGLSLSCALEWWWKEFE